MKKWYGVDSPSTYLFHVILFFRRLRGAGRVHTRPGEGRLLRRAELESLLTTAGRQARTLGRLREHPRFRSNGGAVVAAALAYRMIKDAAGVVDGYQRLDRSFAWAGIAVTNRVRAKQSTITHHGNRTVVSHSRGAVQHCHRNARTHTFSPAMNRHTGSSCKF
jgi:hypothetical protein